MLIRRKLWAVHLQTYMNTHYVGKYDWVAEWIHVAVRWCRIPLFWLHLLKEQLACIWSEVLTAVFMKSSVLCNITTWALRAACFTPWLIFSRLRCVMSQKIEHFKLAFILNHHCQNRAIRFLIANGGIWSATLCQYCHDSSKPWYSVTK